jgi:hypothetical protein
MDINTYLSNHWKDTVLLVAFSVSVGFVFLGLGGGKSE